MKIKALVSLSGPDINLMVGEEQDVEDAIAEDLVNGGLAEALDKKPAKKPKKVADDED